MVVIRFQRLGTLKTPYHRIVVTDRQRAQSSRVLEVVGYYDPSTNPPKFSVDQSRVSHWVASGAQLSEALQKAIKRFAKLAVTKA
ncbi:MAG: 30S ribosomal protein S16 [Candidatus Omnitrophica bacterium]|nr:30S ribosomal protein S16 [Candidatus Omnitrophota bacterium]